MIDRTEIRAMALLLGEFAAVAAFLAWWTLTHCGAN